MRQSEENDEPVDLSPHETRRLEVVRRYHTYVAALHEAGLDHADSVVQRCRRSLAWAIEDACRYDPHLLDDFRRAFAVRRSR